MGITTNCTKFLFYSKQQGASFDQSLMLGRQSLHASKTQIAEIMKRFNYDEKIVQSIPFKDSYAEPLFKLLGAKTIDSIDFSDYEKASILHDLNDPVSENLKNHFSVIFDGGTIEHIFNIPTAFKNCMQMLKIGGHYLSVTPANNMFGHGFYQFSPELFYSLFSRRNGFEVKKVMLIVDGVKDWYEVLNPAHVKSRIFLKNDRATMLMVIAEKIAEVDLSVLKVQQSDYEYTWGVNESAKENKRYEKDSKMMFVYKRYVPGFLKVIVRKFYNSFFARNKKVEGIGEINIAHFKKMDI
jgi:hypothetical protein